MTSVLMPNANDLTKLKSDYLGMTTYYYNDRMNIIVGHENHDKEWYNPPEDVCQRLRQLNHLPMTPNRNLYFLPNVQPIWNIQTRDLKISCRD